MSASTFLQIGTKIILDSLVVKPIENIKLGDRVFSPDAPATVQNIFVSESDNLLKITVDSGYSICVTPEQAFRIPGGQCKAKDLKVDDAIIYFCASNHSLTQYVTDIALVTNPERRIYNLVLVESHLFCANGFMVYDYMSQQ